MRPFLGHTTTASTHHYARVANVATAARCRVPSSTPPLQIDNLRISPPTLAHKRFVLYLKPYLSPSLSNSNFCILSQTLSLASLSNPHVLYFISNPISLYRGRKGSDYDAVAALKWLRWLSQTLFSNPLPRSLPLPWPQMTWPRCRYDDAVAAQEVATMPSGQWKWPRCHYDDAATAMPWLQWKCL